MFSIQYQKDLQILSISGQFDHSRVKESKEVLEKIENSLTINMTGLDFICSGGIGILVMTYSRLKKKGMDLYLTNLNEHIDNVFKVSNLDKIFTIK